MKNVCPTLVLLISTGCGSDTDPHVIVPSTIPELPATSAMPTSPSATPALPPATSPLPAATDAATAPVTVNPVPEQHPPSGATILSVNFDQSPLGTYTRAQLEADFGKVQFVNGITEGRAEIVEGPEAATGRALKVHYPKGVFGPQATGVQFPVKFAQGYDELYASYRVRFAPNYDFVRGGKLPGLAGGGRRSGCAGVPNGTSTQGFTARMMWRTAGAAVQYVYHMDQGMDCGENLVWGQSFVPGAWNLVEHRVRLNTIGLADGLVQGWWNGQQTLDNQGMRFRVAGTQEAPETKIDQLYFSTFFGGNDSSWSPSKDEYVLFDDIKVATAPITFK
ncbi:MAG: hypothetical protein SFV15_26780 [Polyangiaceae bacterium]|nr:hypothetical protein [Polyangiaceae bacterium]